MSPFSRWYFKNIFLEWNVWILIEMSFKLIPKGPTNNISALDQVMAKRQQAITISWINGGIVY